MAQELTTELIYRAVIDSDDFAVDRVVGILTPIIQANVSRVLLRRRVLAQGRNVRQEIEDLVQDVFEILLDDKGRRLLKWNPSCGSAAAFFGLIAQRSVHNILNSRKQSPWTEEPSEPRHIEEHSLPVDNDLERVVSSREMLRTLGQRLTDGLGDRDLRLFELMYVRQVDDELIQGEIGISRDALYQARRRLLKRAHFLAGDIVDEFRTSSVGGAG